MNQARAETLITFHSPPGEGGRGAGDREEPGSSMLHKPVTGPSRRLKVAGAGGAEGGGHRPRSDVNENTSGKGQASTAVSEGEASTRPTPVTAGVPACRRPSRPGFSTQIPRFQTPGWSAASTLAPGGAGGSESLPDAPTADRQGARKPQAGSHPTCSLRPDSSAPGGRLGGAHIRSPPPGRWERRPFPRPLALTANRRARPLPVLYCPLPPRSGQREAPRLAGLGS